VSDIDAAMDRIAKRDEVATVDVDTLPGSVNSGDVDVVFSVEKRPPFEIAFDGYTSSIHPHRWVAFEALARDLIREGDSANFEARLGNEEWGASLKYFTPMMRDRQWGFALNARNDEFTPRGMPEFSYDRYSLRAMRYLEFDGGRVGAGLAGEYTRGRGDSDYVVGPYFYYNRDTLDDMLNPSKGYSLNAQVWWNTADVWVSRTGLTAYVPWSVKRHFVLSFGLETGERGHNVYRAILGDQEELFSLARHPYVGDQAAWARVGVGRNFFNSWWGALRGEVFATYGIVMDDWDKTADAWEVGLALSVPGQFLNGKAVLVYDDRDEFTVGFSLGIPKWWQTPLP
jgi:NTE family protein